MASFVGSGSSEYISSIYGVYSSVVSDPPNSRPGSESDTIYGNGGEDYIDSAGGNDFIYTGAGNDTAYGGAGDDFFDDYTDSSFGGSDTFYGGTGNDTIYGWTGNDTLYGDEGNDLLYGEGDSDTLNGGVGADQMYGGDGSDTYYVDNVGDLVVDDGSGYGYDRVNSAIAFTLGAGLEALTLIGRLAINGTGNELGNDLTGNDSANSLYGLAGDDYLSGEAGADILDGGVGNDELYGGSGVDTLQGGDGNDNLSGGAGVDTLQGGAGNDYFQGDADADTLSGGTGNDTYYIGSTSNIVVETLLQSQGGGVDTIQLGYEVSSYTLGDNLENLQMYWDYIDQAGTGNALANVINGGYGSDRLNGLAGNDTLYGSYGADILDGGTGADTMNGGYDNDIYLVDQSTDLAVETSTYGGRDTVNSTASFTLGANVEDLTLLGSGALNGTGNSGANLIIGTTGVNTLRGLDGADTFRSQSGADIVIGGAGADTFQYQAVQGSNPTQRDSIRSGDGAGAFQGVGAAAGDRLDLSLLDADTTVSGVQDFVFGTATGRGRLWATTVGTSTYINGNTDSDTAIEFQVAIDDGLVTHTAYTSADFLL